MKKVKIKVLSIGHLPLNVNINRIHEWKSSLFEIDEAISHYELRCDADSEGWAFSDDLLRSQLPKPLGHDFTIAIVNVPLEHNWYSRRLGGNNVVFTFHEINNILDYSNINLLNVVYRLLYAYTILYKRSGDRIPNLGEGQKFTHDETRGCLFDMNGIKTDIVASCHRPIICDECEENLKRDKVSTDTIDTAKKEILKIRKDLYYRLADFLRNHPLWAITISSLFAILLGTTSSVLASFVYDKIR